MPGPGIQPSTSGMPSGPANTLTTRHYLPGTLTLTVTVSVYRASVTDSVCDRCSWKVADVVPIFKKGMKSVPGNYRPVSLTSHIGKLMEKFIKEEITSHLDRYDLLNDTQHGFMRGRSRLTNLLTYMEGVTRMLDEGKNVDIIYLDFAKAFDKVPHHRLIDKVASMGVEGRVKGCSGSRGESKEW